MTAAQGVFWLISVVAFAGALGVVMAKNVVHAALALILSLLAVAGYYVLLSNEFLAIVQVLIYAGAVATIILFGLMLTRGTAMPVVTPGGQWPLGLAAAGSLFVVLVIAVTDTTWPRYAKQVTTVDIQSIGNVLFDRWALPFEIASVVLLVALIGAIVISRSEEGEA